MKNQQLGFGGLQVILVVAVIGIMSVVAVPKYKSFIGKAKISEAFNIAGESKRKLSEFYMVNGGFPRNAYKAEAMKTVTFSPPQAVRDMVVEPGDKDHVVVKVFLKEGIVENTTGEEQFIYIAGNKSTVYGATVEWSCGASGVDAELLPENCKG